MNLLPEQDKKDIKKGFKLRFLVVFLIMVSVSIIFSAVMLFPAYVSSKIELDQLYIKSQLINKNLDEESEKLLKLPNEIKSKLQFLKSNERKSKFSEIIILIVEAKPLEIKINSFSANERNNIDNTFTKEIDISGVAKDRKSLLAFTKNLEDTKLFDTINLPVSSLTKDTNLPFKLTVSLKK